MSKIFTPGNIGSLTIQNRLVRSATAERMADDAGQPRQELIDLYRELAKGGVGLIITGHLYVHPSGKAHEEMIGIYSDELIPHLAELTTAVHEEKGLIVAQINHGGMSSDKISLQEFISPSEPEDNSSNHPVRAMTEDDIHAMIDAYGQAARRAKEAGFDGVQIHSAHGYLISQFLSPYINKREDEWGGDIQNRMKFLVQVYKSIREKVGDNFPVLMKFGVKDGVEGGLTLKDSLEVVKEMEKLRLDGIEISGGIGGKNWSNTRKGIRSEADEAYFLPLAKEIRPNTKLPLILVGGMRSQKVMDQILSDDIVDFISMCRPLITEPDFPNKMRLGLQDKSRCISSNNCWAVEKGIGIGCKCPLEKVSK